MEGKDRLAEWSSRWDDGRIQFHRSKVTGVLMDNIDYLSNGKKGQRFLVPLCGKTLDMLWLADHGHYVVGIEGVSKACEDFFKENEIKYTETDVPDIADGKLFKSEDGRILLYCCDIFKLNKDILGQFDAIVDRGSLVAIYEQDRQRYITLMKSVLKTDGRILLMVVEYDSNERKVKGPPRPFFRNDLDKLYGDWCELREIDRSDMMPQNPERFGKQWGLSSIWNIWYLVNRS
ncbi:probable thiopurine S-methyltransferase [Apostichopus japonicus]|uniref:probable thiopurine S-methyltransferase n=1 Tax=Stichopus japonicus TaxID=307972 RepID=UPI003AB5CA4B